eukprot:559195-Rhodomonas_salina.2
MQQSSLFLTLVLCSALVSRCSFPSLSAAVTATAWRYTLPPLSVAVHAAAQCHAQVMVLSETSENCAAAAMWCSVSRGCSSKGETLASIVPETPFPPSAARVTPECTASERGFSLIKALGEPAKAPFWFGINTGAVAAVISPDFPKSGGVPLRGG